MSKVFTGTTFVQKSFFVTRPGLWVMETFDEYISPVETLHFEDLSNIRSMSPGEKISEKGIVRMFGGIQKARRRALTLGQLAEIIRQQPSVETEGLLLTTSVEVGMFTQNFDNTSFFVVDKDNKLRSGMISWDNDYLFWALSLFPVEDVPGKRFLYNALSPDEPPFR